MASEWNLDLLSPPGGVGKGLPDVIFLEIWIELEDLLGPFPAGDQADDHADGHPHSSDARFPAHDPRINGDSI